MTHCCGQRKHNTTEVEYIVIITSTLADSVVKVGSHAYTTANRTNGTLPS